MGQAELLPVNPKAGKYLLVIADAFGACDASGWLRSTRWAAGNADAPAAPAGFELSLIHI